LGEPAKTEQNGGHLILDGMAAAERRHERKQRAKHKEHEAGDDRHVIAGHVLKFSASQKYARGYWLLLVWMLPKSRLGANKSTNEHPDDWPKGVRAISQEGLTLFGIKESTGQLYWDGAQVKTRNLLSLGTPERWMAGLQRSVLSARSQSTSHVS
jgi:hypothetical protein